MLAVATAVVIFANGQARRMETAFGPPVPLCRQGETPKPAPKGRLSCIERDYSGPHADQLPPSFQGISSKLPGVR
jgi:hypothetical protein